VDYDAIATYFLTPTGDAVHLPDVPATPARRLRDSLEAIATVGWWSREAAAGLTALGHGFFDGYVWGRAAALGADVTPAVVVSAFGAFNSALLAPVYAQARTVSSAAAVLAARSTGAAGGLRAATKDVATELISSLADKLLPAMALTSAGSRPLFAALQSLPVPDDAYGRLWRAAELFREHRGDGHLAVCSVQALGVAEMNVLTELWLGYSVGDYASTRGFSGDDLTAAVTALRLRGWLDDSSALTAKGRTARELIESMTDQSQNELVRQLGTAEDVERIIHDADQVTRAILDHRAAPADPRKRYAG
jgi:hypothetical protein